MMGRVIRVFGGTQESIGRLLIACMAVGFTALLAAGGAAVWTTMRNQAHTDAVNHTYSVKLTIEHTRTLIEQGETARLRWRNCAGSPRRRSADSRAVRSNRARPHGAAIC
jgi:hypothetical protein